MKRYGWRKKGRAALVLAALLLLDTLFLSGCRQQAGEEPGKGSVSRAEEAAKTADPSEPEAPEAGPYTEQEEAPRVLVNREGYRPEGDKEVIFQALEAAEESYEVVDEKTGETVFKGDIEWFLRDQNDKTASGAGKFKYVIAPGTYYVRTEHLGNSYSFRIDASLYQDNLKEALKLFFQKRCTHTQKALPGEADAPKDLSGGWHDEGTERSVIEGCRAAAGLMLAYRFQPEKFDDALGIPESGNGIPDILDEVRFEMDWILKMQADDGGVYQMASEERADPPSTNAAAAASAVLSMFSSLYGEYDKEFADTCLTASKRAWTYLERNPEKQPSGVAGDEDERYFAAAELYRLTGEIKYKAAAEAYISHDTPIGLFSQDMGAFGTLAYLTTENSTDIELCGMLMYRLLNEGNVIWQDAEKNAYGVSGSEYLTKESDRLYLNNCIILIYTNSINPDEQFKKAIASHINYFLGCNPKARNYMDVSGGYGPDTTDSAWNAALVFVLSYMS